MFSSLRRCWAIASFSKYFLIEPPETGNKRKQRRFSSVCICGNLLTRQREPYFAVVQKSSKGFVTRKHSPRVVKYTCAQKCLKINNRKAKNPSKTCLPIRYFAKISDCEWTKLHAQQRTGSSPWAIKKTDSWIEAAAVMCTTVPRFYASAQGNQEVLTCPSNTQPVICSTNESKDPCVSRLFTLLPKTMQEHARSGENERKTCPTSHCKDRSVRRLGSRGMFAEIPRHETWRPVSRSSPLAFSGMKGDR